MNQANKLWSLPSEKLLSELQSTERGLSEQEAKKRLAEEGYNEVSGKISREWFEIFFSQYTSPLVLLLIGAAIVSYLLGGDEGVIDAVVILSIVFINSLIGFFQEYKAEKTLAELKKYVTLRCKVLRDGIEEEIDSRELVVGDIVYLNIGDIVPADIRLLAVDELMTNESVLTGESMPVVKDTLPTDEKYTTPQNIHNVAFMGTSIAGGTGHGVVIATGRNTFFGKTAAYLKQTVHEGDFQRNIRKFSDFLLKVILIMTIFVFVANALIHKRFFDSFIFAIALAVGITPEILPIIVTISLSHGALKMAKEKVIIKKLVSVEDLGNIDVLCCDKTGTLTEGELSLVGCFNLEGREDEKILIRGLLCNTARVKGSKKSIGNPIDRAIWKNSKSLGLRTQIEKYQLVDVNEFDFERRRMSVVVDLPEGRTLIAKGAPESMLNASSFALMDGQKIPINEQTRSRIKEIIELYEHEGYRVIAVSEKKTEAEKTTKEDEKDLTLLGFLLFIDPPKKTAKSSLKLLKKLGISIKIISGDSSLVTRKICYDVGLCSDLPTKDNILKETGFVVEKNRVVTGEELEDLSEEEFREYVKKYNVFARVTPEQKYKIVSTLMGEGHIVGFLGDGINDVPALKAADVSISVDSAAGIAKEEADIILLKKSLHVLAHGIIEGRKTFGNITKYIVNTISANHGNMVTVALSSLFLPFIPLLPSQILLNNFISDIPLLTISTDNVDEELLKKPRRWNLKMISEFMLHFGALSSVFDLLFIIPLLFFFGAGVELFRTAWFLESVLSEIIVTFSIRTNKVFYKSRPSNWLLLTSIAAGAAALAVVFTNFGLEYFKFVPLPPSILFFMFTILLAYVIATEEAKKHFFRRFGL